MNSGHLPSAAAFPACDLWPFAGSVWNLKACFAPDSPGFAAAHSKSPPPYLLPEHRPTDRVPPPTASTPPIPVLFDQIYSSTPPVSGQDLQRSEERRVGTECRSRCAP